MGCVFVRCGMKVASGTVEPSYARWVCPSSPASRQQGPVSSHAGKKSETGSSCVEVSASVPGSWWVWPIALSLCSDHSKSRPWRARAWSHDEVERFERRWPRRRRYYEGIIHNVAQVVGNSEAEIFKSHLQIVNDPSLRSKVRSLIENQRLTALSALQAVMNSYAAQFAQIKQENFRERMTDIRDVILTIESHLSRRNGGASRAGRRLAQRQWRRVGHSGGS